MAVWVGCILALISLSCFLNSAVAEKGPLRLPKWSKTSQERRVVSASDDEGLCSIVKWRGGGGQTRVDTKPPVSSSRSAAIAGLKSFAASGLAAGCSKVLLAPFDTIKTVQQRSIIEGGRSLGLGEAAKIIVSRGNGVLELYAGVGVAVLGSMPGVGLYFGVYSFSKRTIGPILIKMFGSGKESDGNPPLLSDRTLRTLTVAVSAAIGNSVASFSRVPYEVVKQKIQTGQYDSTFHAIRTMMKADGMRSFFPVGGISIQMIRDIPYAICTLLAYEGLRDHWVTRAKTPSAWHDLTAGAIAGGIGSYVTNPLDVIKTRIQTDPELYGGDIMACFRATLVEGGPMAFLRGSVPRLMQKIPANGAFFVFYELFQRAFNVDGPSTKTSR